MAPSCHPLASDSASLDVPLLFLTGMTVSLGHCLGMCGPLQSAFAMRAKSRGSLVPALLRYHGARIAAYAFLGGALGWLGTMARLGSVTASVQAVLSLCLGLIMIAVAMGLMGVLGWPEGLRPSLPSRWLSHKGGSSDLLLGLANGFLPCGAVAAVSLSAVAAAHAGIGAFLLLVYGAGTLPVLLAAGLASTWISLPMRRRFQSLATILVILLGLQLMLRGAAVMGWLPHLGWGRVLLW